MERTSTRVLRREGLDKILSQLTAGADIQPLIGEQTSLEIVRRVKGNTEFWFILNLTGEPQPAPQSFAGEMDILTSQPVAGELKPFDALLVRRDK